VSPEPLEPPIFALSTPGHRGVDLPAAGVPAPGGRAAGVPAAGHPEAAAPGAPPSDAALADLLPGVRLRMVPPALPEVAEAEVVRHYTRLAHLNHCVDTGFYPLGSCTMKYNPKFNDEMAALPGFADVHPYQLEADVQGILELMYQLEQALLEITGMHRASLQPAAGAQGELAGILMIKAYHQEHSQTERDTVIVPDSAHGTNLSSATMGGFRVVEIPSSSRGVVDMDALRANLSEHTAAIMLTNPNTLGLFEEDILEISRLVHKAGALCYYDGANLNAIMGKARPGDMGMDVVHLNLHKTFSTPHGGGGPGAGPVAVCRRLEPYLPLPLVALASGGAGYRLDHDRPRSIGRMKGFYGNVGVLVRAYCYLLRMGGDGLERASEDAVLNANYLRSRLERLYPLPYDGPSMHEFVLSTAAHGPGTARDIAKRILDFGMHAPTVYFPLIVQEALMIEPTETEDLATLDRFAEVMEQIDAELRDDPLLVASAPHSTPVRRPDEARAARDPILRWSP
jgi:glycine dehydrogenase subunit 2